MSRLGARSVGRPPDLEKSDRSNKTLRISEDVWERLVRITGPGRVSDQVQQLILDFLERVEKIGN